MRPGVAKRFIRIERDLFISLQPLPILLTHRYHQKCYNLQVYMFEIIYERQNVGLCTANLIETCTTTLGSLYLKKSNFLKRLLG